MVAATKGQARSLANPHRQLRNNHAVGAPANAVGAKIFARHLPLQPRLRRRPKSLIHLYLWRYRSKSMAKCYAMMNGSASAKSGGCEGLTRPVSVDRGRRAEAG